MGRRRRGRVAMINELPEALLCSILSLLPIKQALAVSSVCRRWRHMWKFLTNLDLHSDATLTWSLSGITTVVFSQQCNFIPSCRIVFPKSFTNFETVRILIEFLVNEKRLEKLVLVLHRHSFKSSGFFNGTNLRVLELVSTQALTDDHSYLCSYFDGCVNLETLKLDSLKLNLQSLARIIDNCKVLENLALINLRLMSNGEKYSFSTKVILEIQSQGLKHLEIDNCNLQSFSLHCESLNYLELKNLELSGLVEVNCESCPNLVDFRIDSVSSQSRDRLLGLLESKVRKFQSPFNMAKSSDLELLRSIFDKWTQLQHICLINEAHEGETNEEYRHYKCFWEAGGQRETVLTYDLKVVEIRCFRGSPVEMILVGHLLQNAVGLEKFVIQFGHNISEETKSRWKLELLSLPRAPLNKFMVFNIF